MPDLCTTSSNTALPKSWADILENEPPKLPTAVLAAEAITIFVIN